GRREQLARVAARGLVVALAAQHAHDLGDELVAVDPLDRRLRALAPGLLDDPEVRVGHRRNLRQVCDADELALGSQLAKLLPHRPGGVAADAGVDLVEDHRASAAPGPEAGEREHDPRELAARCGIAERRRGNPRVGRHQELDRLRSAGAETVGVWLDVHFYKGALHRERAELVPYPALELLRGLGTRLGELRRV